MVGLAIRASSAVGIFPAAEAFDYYIGTSGSDSNPGTLEQPWAITAINTKRATYAGKTVGILDGTYDLNVLVGQPSALGWTRARLEIASGSALARTVIKAVNRHQAIISGNKATLASSDQCALMGPVNGNGSYFTIDGLRFTEGNYQLVHAHTGSDNFTIQNCYFDKQYYDNGAGGGLNVATLLLHGVDTFLVRNNYFEDCNGVNDSNRHDFILIYGVSGNSINGVIEYNTVTNVVDGGNGTYFKTAGGYNRNMTFRYNAIDRSGASGVGTNYGLLVSGSNNSADYFRAYGNIIDGGSGRPSIMFTQEGHAGEASFYNNTLVSGSGTTEGMGVLTLVANTFDPSPINYYNNIHSRAGIGFNGDVRFTSVAALNDVDYNCYDTSPSMSMIIAAGAGSGTYTSLSAWRTATSKETNSITTTDPLFAGTGSFAAKYALQAGSPARITGLNSASELGAYGAPGYDGLGIGYSASRS